MTPQLPRWLTRGKKPNLPVYVGLRSIPMSELAPELVEKEQSAAHSANRDAIERSLLEPPRCPSEDTPLFTTLLDANKQGVVTMALPGQSERCVPVFTAAVRAADYTDVLLPRNPSAQYLVSSSLGLLNLLRDLRAVGVASIALDRCPRCAIFNTVHTLSLKTASDLIRLWSIVKATQLARLDLYMGHALRFAHAGIFPLARQIAFEAIVHVNPDDPRPHLLLGQLGLALSDDALVRDAKAFLHFLKLQEWARKLEQDEQSGSLDFEGPAFFSKLQNC